MARRCTYAGCGALLSPTASPAGDEFIWVDERGASFVSHRLHDEMDELEAQLAHTTDQADRDVLLHRRHQVQYLINFGGWGHTHMRALVPPTSDPVLDVPEHCERPMRLTPAAWVCRDCPHRVPCDGLAELAAVA
jgi:hypothetical protein